LEPDKLSKESVFCWLSNNLDNYRKDPRYKGNVSTKSSNCAPKTNNQAINVSLLCIF